MKHLVPIIAFLFLHCLNSLAIPPVNETIFSDTTFLMVKKFSTCFNKLDTIQATQDVKVRNVASCTWGTYKVISKKYILRINPHFFTVRLNKCYDIYIDSVHNSSVVELLVYNNLDATLDNICTDMGNYNSPHYTTKLRPKNGHLYIGFTSLTKEVDWPDISVLIKHLVFIDPSTNKKIEFSNELIWKCYYDGMPG